MSNGDIATFPLSPFGASRTLMDSRLWEYKEQPTTHMGLQMGDSPNHPGKSGEIAKNPWGSTYINPKLQNPACFQTQAWSKILSKKMPVPTYANVMAVY